MARTKEFDENEVLKKAICLFWNKGYNGTSMQELVDGLGISRSSLYDTFGDKHQLYLKALEAYRDGYGDRLCTLITEAPSAKSAVKDIFELVVNDLLDDQQRKGCFLVNAGIELAAHDQQVNQLICQNEQELEHTFLKIITQGQKNGELDPTKDAQSIARFLNNTVKGMQVSVSSTTDQKFFNDIVNVALTVLNQ
ncbi:TetR/AcrR family transcriptional regulator [Mucilaginibacter daejeonensis]|uniref:TetR/AcrR family transcriptional regulator n=1 Tax=Mucilaginibacter daejeonensis TaxID=398049 RepID=UPI001D170B15|nr:TetR/AcrR family transcriptional regulator [Mucilaginibacter daejeonensis]UEG52494.1 TetR/AcrR family transcriptional regulator [Mucilaginibacter daejeonensis]